AEDFRQVRDAVRQLVRESVVPREEQIEDEDRIPDDLRARAAEMGLFGYALPEEHGGLGVSMAEDVELAFEFGYTTPTSRSLFGTNNGIAGQVIARFGSDEQKKTYLPRLAAGELIGSFALTEAEAGSDPAGLRTTARRDGDGWVVNGGKRYITNAPIADLFVVFARSDPAEKGGRGISTFVVDESVAYAATAQQGGAPIGRFQLVQAMLAESHAELLAARSMVVDAAARYDSGEDTSVGPSAAKLFCSEMVGRATDRAVQVHGGLGYLRTTPVERFYRDARLYRLYEGTSEVQKVIIGGALLRAAGMPRS